MYVSSNFTDSVNKFSFAAKESATSMICYVCIYVYMHTSYLTVVELPLVVMS